MEAKAVVLHDPSDFISFKEEFSEFVERLKQKEGVVEIGELLEVYGRARGFESEIRERIGIEVSVLPGVLRTLDREVRKVIWRKEYLDEIPEEMKKISRISSDLSLYESLKEYSFLLQREFSSEDLEALRIFSRKLSFLEPQALESLIEEKVREFLTRKKERKVNVKKVVSVILFASGVFLGTLGVYMLWK